jgi:hypothetical protein
VIDNKKYTQQYNDDLDLPETLKMEDKYQKIRGNEILVIACHEAEREGQKEGYIIVGGNSVKIQVYSIKTG